MKKVIGMLALVALVGNIANAELLKNFKYDGKIEVNAYTNSNDADMNSDVNDKTSDVDTRVQLNMGFDLSEDVNAVVSIVKNDRQYGEGSQDVNTITTLLNVEQAYLNLKGVMGFDHKVGRQYYGNEGDLVVYYGPTAWPYMSRTIPLVTIADNAMPVNALDAYTGWYKTGKWDFHAVLGKTANNNATPNVDTDLTGVVASYDLREEVKLGAYVYERKTYALTNDTTLDVVGVKAMGKVKGFDYGAELAKNYGRKAAGVNYTGSAFKANLAYGLDLSGKMDLTGEYVMGSGNKASADKDEDFTAISSDYRVGMMNAFNNVNGVANLTAWNVGAKWMPSAIEKLSLGAKVYHMSPTEEPAGYDTYGNELDLCAGWMHSENVGLKAYFAYFMPDSDYADTVFAGKDDASTLLGASLTVKF
ncbi:MAG: hypothetical protein AB7V08_12535 [Elusimicrobiales bacterium]